MNDVKKWLDNLKNKLDESTFKKTKDVIDKRIDYYLNNELSIKNTDKLNHYFLNKYKIVKQIDDSRKFNLDKKNLFIYLSGLLNNESK
mgnify:CR=1 FL=1